MDQDQDIQNLFHRLDRSIEELPPPTLPVEVGRDIHRFRSPFVRFLEWVINGGAGMALVFGLASLSTLLWSGTSFGWVILPVVLFLMRPFLGENPVQRPWRMVSVLLLGSVLSAALAAVVDFAVACYPDYANVVLFGFFVERSVGTLFHWEYALAIVSAMVFAVVWTRWIARRNPWLTRKVPTGRRRTVISLLFLALIGGVFSSSLFKSEGFQFHRFLQGLDQDPRMVNFAHWTNLADEGSAAAEELAKLGVPVGQEERFQFLRDSDGQTLRAVASVLTESFQERKLLVTRADLALSLSLLKTVADSEEVQPDLAFTGLWWEVLCFSQDYGVPTGFDPAWEECMRKVAMPPLIDPALSQEEAKLWYDRMRARPTRDLVDIQETRRMMAAHVLLVERQFQVEPEGLLEKYEAEAQNRFLLMKFTHHKRKQLPSFFAPFGVEYTRDSQLDVFEEISDRVKPDLHRVLLIGILEARLVKAETGEYPQRLQNRAYKYEYENSAEGALFNELFWNRDKEFVCRLPR